MGSEVVIVPSLFLMIGYVFYVVSSAFTRRQQLRSATEFQAKLLDRMGSVGELAQFLNTPSGQQFLTALSTEQSGGQAHQRVLRATQSGIVMFCLGIGIFLFLGNTGLEQETYQSIGFVGTVSAAVGAGLLASGWVSLKLSRRMGLINGTSHLPAVKEVSHSA